MRTLKFRAWDTANKRWATESDFKEVGLFVNYYIDGSGKFELQADVNECGYGRFEIVEFAGLKDRNGKEIYEGDILYCSEDPGSTHLIKWFEEMGRWNYDRIEDGEDMHCHYDMKDFLLECKIIGNIYENPELLK